MAGWRHRVGSLLADVVEVARALVVVERQRSHLGPADMVLIARQKGRAGQRRDAAERARLQRLICRVDRFFPGGTNCYRRVVAEMALDAGAADERLCFGLRSAGGPGSGHAWLESDSARGGPYAAEFSL
jgi:hypothetical protein